MSKHFDRDLEKIKKELLNFSYDVEEAMRNAINALRFRRADLASETVARDVELDNREVHIEEECLKCLALHQPVATDLRFLVMVLKVNNDLERVADLAKNIAQRAEFLATQPPLQEPEPLARMVEVVQHMVRDAIQALVDQDSRRAKEIVLADSEVDDLHREMYGVLTSWMRSDPAVVDRSVQWLTVSRNLERIADQATNIAEDVVFLVDAEIIRHMGDKTLERLLAGKREVPEQSSD